MKANTKKCGISKERHQARIWWETCLFMKSRPSYKEQSWGLGAVFQWHYDSSEKYVDMNFVYMCLHMLKNKTEQKKLIQY